MDGGLRDALLRLVRSKFAGYPNVASMADDIVYELLHTEGIDAVLESLKVLRDILSHHRRALARLSATQAAVSANDGMGLAVVVEETRKMANKLCEVVEIKNLLTSELVFANMIIS